MTLYLTVFHPQFIVIGADKRQDDIYDTEPERGRFIDNNVTKIVPVTNKVAVFGYGQAVNRSYMGRFLASQYLDTAGDEIKGETVSETASKLLTYCRNNGLDQRNAELGKSYQWIIAGYDKNDSKPKFFRVDIPGDAEELKVRGEYGSINCPKFQAYGNPDGAAVCSTIFNKQTLAPNLTILQSQATVNLKDRMFPITGMNVLEAYTRKVANSILETIEMARLYMNEPDVRDGSFTVPLEQPFSPIGGNPDVAVITPETMGFRWRIKNGNVARY